MTILDKSNYFKGLLILAGKDNYLDTFEVKILREIGQTLGFEKKFYEDAIQYILENEFISKEPPKFSTKKTAEHFIKDGIKLALADKEMNPNEIEWLKEVAEHNNISLEWLNSELKLYIQEGRHKNYPSILDLNSLHNSI